MNERKLFSFWYEKIKIAYFCIKKKMTLFVIEIKDCRIRLGFVCFSDRKDYEDRPLRDTFCPLSQSRTLQIAKILLLRYLHSGVWYN